MLILGRSFFSIKVKQTYTLMSLRNHITFQNGNRDQRLSNEFPRFFVICWKFGNCEKCRLLVVTVRLEFYLLYLKRLSHYVNTSKHFFEPNLNWNTRFSPILMENAVSTVSLSVDSDEQNILKLFQKLPLWIDFNIAMASRLIQGQTRTLDNNVSCEMTFLWSAIYTGCHFCELVVPFILGAIFASWYFW